MVIDPRESSGAATVRGIRTEVLAERERAGDGVEDLADEFGVTEQEVRDGLSFEWSRSWPTESAA